MRLLLEDFKYCGEHIDIYEVELPQVDSLENFTMEQICEYVLDELDEYLCWTGKYEEE